MQPSAALQLSDDALAVQTGARMARLLDGVTGGAPRVAAQDGEDAQDLDVQPHHGHGEAEGEAPGVLLRDPGLGRVLDVLEVHHQRVGGHDDGEAADDEAEHIAAQRPGDLDRGGDQKPGCGCGEAAEQMAHDEVVAAGQAAAERCGTLLANIVGRI